MVVMWCLAGSVTLLTDLEGKLMACAICRAICAGHYLYKNSDYLTMALFNRVESTYAF